MAIYNDSGEVKLTPRQVAVLAMSDGGIVWEFDPFTKQDAQDVLDSLAWIDFTQLTPKDERGITEAMVKEYYRIVQPSIDVAETKKMGFEHLNG
jgi:hypothetical protein